MLAAVFAAGCSRTPDEVRIREAITAMETAVEAREPRAFMEHVADDFTGNRGSIDRAQLHNLLRGQFLRNEEIGVTLGPIEVELMDKRATAKVTATLTGGGSGGWIPERGAAYAFTTGWKNDGGEWRCISAEWEAL
ncbi:MAG TPA: nuclear transport factor 2 family protein [Tahibacter sp.]|nr:nuclear transport factor 2 family protein [Tahibacter sp.]